MSLYDKFRTLRTDLFEKFEAPVATIERTTFTRTNADRASGSKGEAVTTVIVGRGILGSRRVANGNGTYRLESIAAVANGNGTYHVESIATLDIPALPGDKLSIGTLTYEVASVEAVNPIGEASPIVCRAVLK